MKRVSSARVESIGSLDERELQLFLVRSKTNPPETPCEHETEKTDMTHRNKHQSNGAARGPKGPSS